MYRYSQICDSQVLEGPKQANFLANRNCLLVCSDICVQKGTQLKYKLNLVGRDRLQHDRPVVSATAQQYYSSTFILLRFYFRKEKCSTSFTSVIISIYFLFFFLNCVNLKFRNLELRKSGRACFIELPKHPVCISQNIQRLQKRFKKTLQLLLMSK